MLFHFSDKMELFRTLDDPIEHRLKQLLGNVFEIFYRFDEQVYRGTATMCCEKDDPQDINLGIEGGPPRFVGFLVSLFHPLYFIHFSCLFELIFLQKTFVELSRNNSRNSDAKMVLSVSELALERIRKLLLMPLSKACDTFASSPIQESVMIWSEIRRVIRDVRLFQPEIGPNDLNTAMVRFVLYKPPFNSQACDPPYHVS